MMMIIIMMMIIMMMIMMMMVMMIMIFYFKYVPMQFEYSSIDVSCDAINDNLN